MSATNSLSRRDENECTVLNDGGHDLKHVLGPRLVLRVGGGTGRNLAQRTTLQQLLFHPVTKKR